MDEFLTTKEIAKLLKVNIITIRRWIDKKLLPSYKLGKEFRIKKNDFDKFLADRRIQK